MTVAAPEIVWESLLVTSMSRVPLAATRTVEAAETVTARAEKVSTFSTMTSSTALIAIFWVTPVGVPAMNVVKPPVKSLALLIGAPDGLLPPAPIVAVTGTSSWTGPTAPSGVMVSKTAISVGIPPSVTEVVPALIETVARSLSVIVAVCTSTDPLETWLVGTMVRFKPKVSSPSTRRSLTMDTVKPNKSPPSAFTAKLCVCEAPNE